MRRLGPRSARQRRPGRRHRVRDLPSPPEQGETTERLQRGEDRRATRATGDDDGVLERFGPDTPEPNQSKWSPIGILLCTHDHFDAVPKGLFDEHTPDAGVGAVNGYGSQQPLVALSQPAFVVHEGDAPDVALVSDVGRDDLQDNGVPNAAGGVPDVVRTRDEARPGDGEAGFGEQRLGPRLVDRAARLERER